MPISFEKQKKVFTLTTANTQYIFKIVGDRFLIHCYYGYKSECLDLSYDVKSLGFTPEITDAELSRFSLGYAPMECACYGTGDFRCSSIKIKGEQGDSSTLFTYCGYEIFRGRVEIPGVPYARTTDDTETLMIRLKDEVKECQLKLYYTVYPSHDLITRYFTIENYGSHDVKMQKAMPICLDLPGHDYDVISLYGCQTTERNVQRTPLCYGNYSIGSRRGMSSHNFNPFMALVSKDANEESGDVYAFNFIYSGGFLDEVEVDSQGNTRVGIGLGEENFAYTIPSGGQFASPEGIMLYTSDGLGDMSRKMHRFVKDTILLPEPYEKRPVVLNTWEAFHFDINEQLILGLADECKECGIDMLVIDDGWFGERDDDTSSLGDWYPNPKKFPNGLKPVADGVHEKGIKFGIWIEPEMISPESELYRKHPEWCLHTKGRTPILSRNQLVLDLCNPEVLQYLKDTFTETFEGVDIDYIKWDFNRPLCDVGSSSLSKEQQDEATYRFQLGVYELYDWFLKKFPHVMIENCSGGGGRYDLGMMAVSTQVWASDNTGAKDRVRIQYGSTLGYPASVMSCHVSQPYGNEGQLENLDYKFKVAVGGMLGYEFDISKVSAEMKQAIKSQIAFYRKVEEVIKNGHLFRLVSPFENDTEVSAYYYADKEQDANRIFFTYLQNFPYRKRDISWHVEIEPQKVYCMKIKAADAHAIYREEISGKSYSGMDLQRGIQIRMSEDGEFGIQMVFQKIGGI